MRGHLLALALLLGPGGVALALPNAVTGWATMRHLAIVSVQEPEETFASGILLPNAPNVAALEQQVVAAVTKGGRSVVDLSATRKLMESDDFYRAVLTHLDNPQGGILEVRGDYSRLSGDLLKNIKSSENTTVALNMFAHDADTRFRTWLAPSAGPLLASIGADGYIMVGASPELEASYSRGPQGVRIDSGLLQGVGTRLVLWLGDAHGNVLAALEESASERGSGPERFQIDQAVQEMQQAALDKAMHELDVHPPETPKTHTPQDGDIRD